MVNPGWSDCSSAVQHAQAFVIAGIPFRGRASRDALDTFTSIPSLRDAPGPVLDAILLRLLTIVQRHAARHISSVIDRYLDLQSTIDDPVARFALCAREAIDLTEITHPKVRGALQIIEHECANPSLTLSGLAARLDISAGHLGSLIHSHTGASCRHHLRTVRVRRAMELLRDRPTRIKEVWAAVGYNHAADFNHQFRDACGLTPRQFREQELTRSSRLIDTVRSASAACGLDISRGDHPSADDIGSRRTLRPNGKGMRVVLLAAADHLVRDAFARGLQGEGYVVSTAADDQTAVREAERLQPSVIFLDYRGPGIDGLACLRTIRASPRTCRTPVVIVAADWSVHDHAREIQQLAGRILSQPTAGDEVVALANRVTSG
jgi:CheY-like chemotaxis protein/AraC-like DNA-binding protein